jgi:hypothetical protein
MVNRVLPADCQGVSRCLYCLSFVYHWSCSSAPLMGPSTPFWNSPSPSRPGDLDYLHRVSTTAKQSVTEEAYCMAVVILAVLCAILPADGQKEER